MTDRNETLADIVAWIRRQAEQMDFGTADAWSPMVVRKLADRIEAAAKRETVTDCHGFGNAAKLREALETIAERAEDCRDVPEEYAESSAIDYLSEAKELARAALAAPPRNCDVGAPEEQEERFNAYCRKIKTCERCRDCMNGYGAARERCVIEWEQAPYDAAQEGGDQ